MKRSLAQLSKGGGASALPQSHDGKVSIEFLGEDINSVRMKLKFDWRGSGESRRNGGEEMGLDCKVWLKNFENVNQYKKVPTTKLSFEFYEKSSISSWAWACFVQFAIAEAIIMKSAMKMTRREQKE